LGYYVPGYRDTNELLKTLDQDLCELSDRNFDTDVVLESTTYDPLVDDVDDTSESAPVKVTTGTLTKLVVGGKEIPVRGEIKYMTRESVDDAKLDDFYRTWSSPFSGINFSVSMPIVVEHKPMTEEMLNEIIERTWNDYGRPSPDPVVYLPPSVYQYFVSVTKDYHPQKTTADEDLCSKS